MLKSNPPTDTSDAAVRPRRRLRVRWLLPIAAAVGVGAWFAFSRGDDAAVDRLLERGEHALENGQFAAAWRFAELALEQAPDQPKALLLAGRAGAGRKRVDEAQRYLERVPDDAAEAADARFALGELSLLEWKRLTQAEQEYRRALERDGEHLAAHRRLAYVLGLQSRQWEAIPHRLTALQTGAGVPVQLYLLSLGTKALENPAEIRTFAEASPEDPAIGLAHGRLHLAYGRNEQAKQLLEGLIDAETELMRGQRIAAHVRLGEALLALSAEAEFARWHARPPPGADRHPGVWALRGAWAERNGAELAAIRCYWEALRLDPNRHQANYRLGQLLVRRGEPQQAQPFLTRAAQLEQYAEAAKLAYHVPEPENVHKAAEAAESCGLAWEAAGWCREALSGETPPEWARRQLSRLKPQLSGLPRQRAAAEVNPAASADLSSYPLLVLKAGVGDSRRGTSHFLPSGGAGIAFSDDADRAGLRFQYFNTGSPETTGLARMYEVVGGGVGAFDYDGDGWTDLYFPQGTDWPPESESTAYLDRLFRNQGDGTFADVTRSARIVETGFSQGVAAGDFNNDGFPDLYVSNIGANRLLLNNGDGTFSDVTAESGTAGDRYTASGLIADLNGDRLPDIYAVNYLSGRDLFTKVCGDAGKPRSCLPYEFDAAQDRLYLNRGDGRFEEATDDSGIVAPNGKGLGIVAGDFDGSGRLSLFVANDVAANFFFVNVAETAGERPLFVEEALPRGLALNGDGRQESSMGIAAGDFDGDGRLELFVTNFDDETNTLYRQLAGMGTGEAGLFVDATRESGLEKKRLPAVGWGTQAIDADLDGRLDLVLTNGHVNDVRDHGKPFQMPPQFFRNAGGGRFIELPAQSLGPYFQGDYLGRGMARLDWNRDGREDVVISHLDAPGALLTNTTRAAGHFLSVRLVGVESARDAIGATVTLRSGKHVRVRQLTAGDGNQSSNERRLIFGLGRRTSIESVEVRWPSGLRQEFRDLPLDAELLLIEGRGRPITPPVP